MVKEIEGTKLLRVIKNKNKRDNVINNNPIHKFDRVNENHSRNDPAVRSGGTIRRCVSGGTIWRYDPTTRSIRKR